MAARPPGFGGGRGVATALAEVLGKFGHGVARMAYLSLYRKWRPQTFEAVVGQEHIVRTLTNALNMGRVAHAYLFAGPRGTGKTTLARLLAKGLNCAEGPTGAPCDRCHSCTRITRGAAVDVIEIDGASNRGIDEIRELRERVRYAPTEGRSKVYIIDEVHMLTNEAFNALLKVLEEPPAHVVFVFATTEAHKVPATILSRCQKFDFRRFSAGQLAAHLKDVAKSEGVSAEEPALALIARHAEGGMRDALAVMDQCLATDPAQLTVATVVDVLGIVRRDALMDLAGHILSQDLPAALKLVHALLDEGIEVRQLVKDLASYTRDLVLMKAAPGLPDLVTAEEMERVRMRQQVEQGSLDQLLRMVSILAGADAELRWSTSPTMAVEMALAKAVGAVMEGPAASPADQASWDDLARRVQALEAALQRRETLVAGPGLPGQPPSAGPPPAAPTEAAPVAAGEKSPPARHEAVATDGGAEVAELQAKWPAVLSALKEERMISTEAYLRVGVPGEIEGNTVTIYFSPGYKFHQANIENAQHRSAVERVISRVMGRELQVRTTIGTPPQQPQPHGVAEGPGPPSSAMSRPKVASGSLAGEPGSEAGGVQPPAVQKALQYLGGRATRVDAYEEDR